MNSDAAMSLLRQVLTLVLSSSAVSGFMDGSQTQAIVSGACALVSVAWSVYAHWGMKKVPVGATVVGGGK